MRVALLGGAGALGRRVSSILVADGGIDSLLIADADPEAAALEADRLGSVAEATWSDLTDPREARSVLGDCDLAVGCLGGHPSLEVPLVEAAIDCGTAYVSSCDNWRETESALELSVDAAEAGAFALVGLGASPGLSNLLAVHASREFESVESVDISWVGSTNGPSGGSAVAHTFRSFVGRIPVFDRGAWHFGRAGGGRRQVWFPEPVGRVDVVACGHSEPLTLARHIEGVRRVTVSGSVGVALMQDFLRFASRLGMRQGTAERIGGLPGVETWLPGAGLVGGGPRWAGIRVEVRGRHEGQSKTVVLGAIDSMQNLVAGPLAVGALIVGADRPDAAGVFAPEAVLEPTEVFARLARLGVKVARFDRAEELAA